MGEASEGLAQGLATSSRLFCMGWHKFVVAVDRDLEAIGGFRRFGNDDGYLLGPPVPVFFEALDRFTGG